MKKYRVVFTHAVKQPSNTTAFDIVYVNVDGVWTFDQSVNPFTYIRENYNVVGGISVSTYTSEPDVEDKELENE